MAQSFALVLALALVIGCARATISPTAALASCESAFMDAATPPKQSTTTAPIRTTTTTQTTTPSETATSTSSMATTTTSTTPVVTTVAPAVICAAFHELSVCTARVIAVSQGDKTIQDKVYNLLQFALSLNSNCSLSSQLVQPQLRESFGSLHFETDASQTFTLQRYIRDPISLSDLSETIENLREEHMATTDRIVAALTALPVESSTIQMANMKVAAPLAAANVANAATHLAAVESLFPVLERVASIDLPRSITILSAGVSTAIASEALARANTNANTNSLISALSTNINTRFDAATGVRNAVKTVMADARAAILAAGTADFNGQVAAENARAVAETSTLTAVAASLSTSAISSLSTAIIRESSRADANCTAYTAMLGGGPASQNGATDHAACSTAGLMYYSTANRTIFFCAQNTMTWNAYMMGSFYETQILSGAQRSSLALNIGSNWTLCYRALRDGFNTYAFHSLCGWKGPTVTVAITTSGRIYGGYTEVFWGNKNQYVPSPNAFLFRFNPTSTNAATIDVATVRPSNVGNAIFDYFTYPPTFGGGHDLFMGSNGQSGASSSPNTYQAACGSTFDSSFLAGTSSWTNANFEVYSNI